MQSSVYELSGPKQLYLKDEEIDLAGLEDDELVAETIYSAISPGTEVAAYKGASPLRPGKVYPRVLGYCNVAKVINTAKGVTKLEVGDHILSLQSHRTAFKCKEGSLIVKLRKEDNIKLAAVTYLYHLGYHSLISGDAKTGQNVGVIGIGALGYSTCMMSRLIGAHTFAFSNQASTSEILSKQGIACFKKSADSLEQINSLTNGKGLDLVINTSNTWGDWLLAMQIVNKGGTIVNLGFPGRDEPSPEFNPLDPQYIYMKHIAIKPLCNMAESDMQRNMLFILDKINAGKLNPEGIISEEISYHDLGRQYEKYLDKKSSLFTTIINWK